MLGFYGEARLSPALFNLTEWIFTAIRRGIINQFKEELLNQGTRYSVWLSCVLALALGWWAQAAQADQSHEYYYHYISLSEVPLPTGFVQFNSTAIDDSGRVYGDIIDASYASHIAVYAHGTFTVLQPGNTSAVNARGTIGGFVFTDPVNFKFQAALFRGNSVKMIPFLPGDTSTRVLSLNDSDTALVWSEDPSGFNENTYRLYKKGKTLFSYQLPTGSDCSSCWGVNNQGIMVGTIYDPDLNAFRAVRFRHPYGEPQLLDPLKTDTDSTSFGINNSGYIIGQSNVFLGDPTKNHYGIWDQKGNFKSYFEGINYFALFNDKNLIVLTQNFDTDNNSYLVPRPGVRLNIEDLLDNPTEMEVELAAVVDINNRGDMTGYGCNVDFTFCGSFLLRRVFTHE